MLAGRDSLLEKVYKEFSRPFRDRRRSLSEQRCARRQRVLEGDVVPMEAGFRRPHGRSAVECVVLPGGQM
jgi:hypothetical protein